MSYSRPRGPTSAPSRALVQAPRSAPTPQNARRRLRDKVLTVTGGDAAHVAPLVDTATGGLVLTGAHANHAVRELRKMHPNLLLLAEPDAATRYVATASNPFLLNQDGLFSETLTGVLEGQRLSGADLTVTPTGFIEAGDYAALKAAVEAANNVDRDDLVALLPVSYHWMADPHVRQLIAVATRSRHMVAIALGDSGGDPLSHRGVAAGYHRFFSEVPLAMAWRTDIAGFAAMAAGAASAAIGELPSLRRLAPPRHQSMSSDKRDQTPHVLIAELLRYSRTSVMQINWFASVNPYPCDCSFCIGRAVDRFSGSAEDRLAAHLHNTAVVTELATGITSLAAVARAGWWEAKVRGATYAHDRLASYTSVSVDMPANLKAWRALLPQR